MVEVARMSMSRLGSHVACRVDNCALHRIEVNSVYFVYLLVLTRNTAEDKYWMADCIVAETGIEQVPREHSFNIH